MCVFARLHMHLRTFNVYCITVTVWMMSIRLFLNCAHFIIGLWATVRAPGADLCAGQGHKQSEELRTALPPAGRLEYQPTIRGPGGALLD